MRMPGMDGAALLKHARVTCPETTRILLTGYTDIDAAVAAVNEGSVFRFLTKPCSTPHLHAALADAVEQHHLVRDRRELLEQTLRGAVEALVETLAMAHPAAFARASRLRQLVRDVAARLELPDRWQVEVAAQLGEIGVITLPPEALDVLTRGAKPDGVIATMLEALPDVADGLLRRIPRLEGVREIVRAQLPADVTDTTRRPTASRAAMVLQAVREYDALTSRSTPAESAVGILRQRRHHPADILDALDAAVCDTGGSEVREVDVSYLRPGMTLAADLRSSKGILLVSHGHMLTEELLARIRNFSSTSGLESRPLVLIRK